MIFKSLLNELESIIKLGKGVGWLVDKKERGKNTLVSTWLVQLLAAHRIHRNQMPGFLGHGLAIADDQNDELFLSKLNEEILNDVCSKFAVFHSGQVAVICPKGLLVQCQILLLY